MHVVLLIATGMVLGYFARPREKQSYHMAILAILGIAYFCIWRFTDYYLELFHSDTGLKNTVFTSLMLTALIIGLLPWVMAIRRTYAILLAGLFGLCAVLTFSLENGIKNTVAKWGGYFDHPAAVFEKASESANTRRYRHEAGGFSIDVPEHWRKKIHESGLDYFQWEKDGTVQAELRPKCFHNTDISVADIMRNVFQWERDQGFEAEGRCFISEGDGYTCFVQSRSDKKNNVRERWNWKVMDASQRRNIEMDFVFYNDNAETRREAGAMIDSLSVEPWTGPLPSCISLLEWM